MQAILTRYIGATDTKPGRIKAWCEAGNLTVSEHSLGEMPIDHLHLAAATKLAEKLGWTGPRYGNLVQGGLPDNKGYCHVFPAL